MSSSWVQQFVSYQQRTRFRTTLRSRISLKRIKQSASGKWRYQLRFFSTFHEKILVKFGPLTKNDLDLWPMTLKFNRVRAVVKQYVRGKYQAECSRSWVIEYTNIFCPISQWWRILKSSPVTLTFDVCHSKSTRFVCAAVKVRVRAKCHRAKCSGSWVIVRTGKNKKYFRLRTI